MERKKYYILLLLFTISLLLFVILFLGNMRSRKHGHVLTQVKYREMVGSLPLLPLDLRQLPLPLLRLEASSDIIPANSGSTSSSKMRAGWLSDEDENSSCRGRCTLSVVDFSAVGRGVAGLPLFAAAATADLSALRWSHKSWQEVDFA